MCGMDWSEVIADEKWEELCEKNEAALDAAEIRGELLPNCGAEVVE